MSIFVLNLVMLKTECYKVNIMKKELSSLLEKLKSELTWPNNYTFKFIYPQNDSMEGEILEMLENLKLPVTQKSHKDSSKGTYHSLSIVVLAQKPQQVIAVYKTSEKLKGVMVL